MIQGTHPHPEVLMVFKVEMIIWLHQTFTLHNPTEILLKHSFLVQLLYKVTAADLLTITVENVTVKTVKRMNFPLKHYFTGQRRCDQISATDNIFNMKWYHQSSLLISVQIAPKSSPCVLLLMSSNMSLKIVS